MLIRVVAAGAFAFCFSLPAQASIDPSPLEQSSEYNVMFDATGPLDTTIFRSQKIMQSDGIETAPAVSQKETATLLNMLGELYRSQGRYNEAEPLFKRSLAMRERELGPDHTKVAESLNNLAVLYHNLRRYNDAEPLIKRSLIILENALGPDHPIVAQSLQNLASIYMTLGRFDDAIPLRLRALEIARKIEE